MDSPWGKPKTHLLGEGPLLTELFEIPGPCEACGTDEWTYVIPGNPNTQGAWGCHGCKVFIPVKWKTPPREQRAWTASK